MTDEETLKKQEMLEKMFMTWESYVNEAKLCCEALRSISTKEWPDRVLKNHVDELRLALVNARSRLKTSRVLLDFLIESYLVYDHVFPSEKPAFSPQQSAISNQPPAETGG